MHLITATVSAPDLGLPEIELRADRRTLAKRIWRGTAADKTEFGFDLGVPVKPGDVIFQSPSARYVIRQDEEAVLEISLEISPSAAAAIGWAVGNLHLELSSEPTRLLTPDEPAGRQLLDRINVSYRITTAVFRSGRFSRGTQPTHELGPSHRH
jgi:urease accessory protein